MFKSVLKYATVIATTLTSLCSADCQTTFELGVGYRRDLTHWDVEGYDVVGNDINSKMRFKDQDIVLINGKAKMVEDWFYFRADADYGWVVNGKTIQKFSVTPINGNLVGLSNSSRIKSKSHVADVTAAIGYPIEYCCGDFVVAPVVGYSYHYQRFQHKNTFVIPLVTNLVFDDAAHGKEIKNTIKWYGPLVGLDVFWRIDESFNLWGEFEYIFAQCKRTGDNSIGLSAFNEYHNRNRAYGFDGVIGTDFFFNSNLYAGLSVDFKHWRTKKKRSAVKVINDNDESPKSNGLGDRVRWSSVGVNLNLGLLY